MTDTNKAHKEAAKSSKPKTTAMQHGGTGGKTTTGMNNSGKSYK